MKPEQSATPGPRRPRPTLTGIPSVPANGVQIEYETLGSPADPALLLVQGLGGQLISWPEEFCSALAARGFFVVRFDNRDSGLSTRIEDGPVPDAMGVYLGDASSVSYTLDDMADDAAGLLDALGIRAAHLVGISMGGMVAQTLAVRHPHRILTLCSISSTTGDRSVGQPTPEAMSRLGRPAASSRDEAIESGLEGHRLLGSRAYPTDEEEVRRRAARSYERSFCPEGVARQLCAILASGDRTEGLADISVPTLVVHGTDDALIQPSGGEATAKAIPGAELLMIDGMGHDLPSGVWPRIVDAIAANAARRRRS